ncbi:hypothetical protein PG991_011706 [Apiospora marii]|uniref:Uncharacterized protein n=1 Tax=Apiospora marii TaxID=335849 RepID=A0ABR1RFB0_9PEZI
MLFRFQVFGQVDNAQDGIVLRTWAGRGFITIDTCGSDPTAVSLIVARSTNVGLAVEVFLTINILLDILETELQAAIRILAVGMTLGWPPAGLDIDAAITAVGSDT